MARHLGQANVADNRRVTPDTGFALASISKTFTAAVVLELVDEGKLKLDERVAPLLPAFDIDTGSPSGCCSTTPAT